VTSEELGTEMSEHQSFEQELAHGLAIVVKEFVGEQLAPLRAELVALKAANAELRGQIAVLQKSGVHFRDVWEDGTEYSEGDCVVSGGSLWRANATTTFKPGQSTDWRLICRKGRDARDLNGHARS
jgi:hypothetical protein